jgi:hypothetical protein
MPKNETKIGGKLMEKDVTVKANIYKPETLFFRTGLAEARDADGREYEVCSNINGDSILVRRNEPTRGPWMVISSETLVRAYALQVENLEEYLKKHPPTSLGGK